MTTYGAMRRSSAFALLPVLLLALGVDGIKILPQFTSPGTVSKFLRVAIASYKDPLQLSAALGRFPGGTSPGELSPAAPLISTYSYNPHLGYFLLY